MDHVVWSKVFTTMFTGTGKMYDYAQLHIGIDTIKFKLEPINPGDHQTTDLLDLLKDHIRSALNHDEYPCVHYEPNQRAWLVFTHDEYPVCRFYHMGKSDGDMYVELFGMFQAYDGSLLNLSETHATILGSISALRNVFIISITKIDLSIDYFYDFKKSFVYFYGESKENDINKIKKQNERDIAYLGRFPMHTIEVPIDRDDILDFIEKRKRKIKRKKVGESRPDGSYYRFGIFRTSAIFKSFAECEEEDATNIQLKINDKNLFHEVKRLFKGKEIWSYEFDETEDIKLSKSTPKSTWIFYDKTRRDIDGGKDDESEKYTYENIRMEYANNDEDLAEELSNGWRHSRIELRLTNPGVPRQKKPLDPTEETTYPKIFTELERRIKPITIVLIKPNVTNGVYISHCREMQKGQDKPKQIKPNPYQHGKTLKPIEFTDAMRNELEMIKSFFVKVTEPPV